MDWRKKIHDAVLSDDGEETSAPKSRKSFPTSQSVAATPIAPPPPAFSFDATDTPFIVPSSVVPDDAVYQRVLDKTNFDGTPVGRIIHRYFDALDDAGFDTNTRFRTAIKQATKLDGITPDKVLQAFDDLKTALQTETEKFAQVVAAQSQKEVSVRQDQITQIGEQIAQLTQQINDLQTKHTQISAELSNANMRITNAQTQMQLATDRRGHEIDQQRCQFAELFAGGK